MTRINSRFSNLHIFTLALAVSLHLLPTTSEAQPVSTVFGASTGIGDSIAVGPSGDIFGCPGRGIETLIRITPAGERSIFSSGQGSPTGIDFDSAGNAFVANYRQNNVVKITPDGTPSVFASGLNGPAHVAINANDEVFVSEFGANFGGNGARVLRFTPDGEKFTHLSGVGLQDVIGLAFDDDGVLYVGNWQSGRIFRSTGEGALEEFADIPGNVNQIGFNRGFIYAPSSTRIIYRVDLSGNVSAFSGGGRQARRDGLISTSTYPQPNSVAFSADGNTMYVNDAPDGALRAISFTRDTDDDGHADELEMRAGTDPEDPASVLKLIEGSRSEGAMDLRWMTVPGRGYAVDFSTDGAIWEEIGAVESADEPESSFSHGTDSLLGLYRIRLR